MNDTLSDHGAIPGPDPGACPKCGEWRKAGISHECATATLIEDGPRLTPEEALAALNALRSNVVATQKAGWSNTIYPLVAILNDAGMEIERDPSEEQIRQHMACYGGAGGYPGHELREPGTGWCEPVGRLQLVVEAARRVLEDPSEENLGYLRARLPDA